MNEMYSLNAIKFINEIKKRRQLWDSTDNGFKTRNKTCEGGPWEDVAKVFIPNLNRLKEGQRVEIYRKLYKKWRNMKDCHIRMLRKNKTSYVYAKHLSFINCQYNFSNEQQQPTSEEKSSDDETCEDARTFYINISRTTDSDTANCSSCSSDEDTLSTVKNQQFKRLNCGKTIEFVDTPMTPQAKFSFAVRKNIDEDRAFFDSLTPAVRQFNTDQKIEFRCEMLKLIRNIRSSAINHNKPEPLSPYFEDDNFSLK